MNTSAKILNTVVNKQIPIDYHKRNRLSRSRGYSFESDIVNAFNNHSSKDWHAKRLGGTSVGLPDIIVTNNRKSICYAIECKSGQGDNLYIPLDQIQRCQDIVDYFLSIYDKRFVVFAFKFKGDKKKGKKLQYDIILIKNLVYSENLKGVKYHRRKQTLDYVFGKYPINSIIADQIKAYSIDQFINIF